MRDPMSPMFSARRRRRAAKFSLDAFVRDTFFFVSVSQFACVF